MAKHPEKKKEPEPEVSSTDLEARTKALSLSRPLEGNQQGQEDTQVSLAAKVLREERRDQRAAEVAAKYVISELEMKNRINIRTDEAQFVFRDSTYCPPEWQPADPFAARQLESDCPKCQTNGQGAHADGCVCMQVAVDVFVCDYCMCTCYTKAEISTHLLSCWAKEIYPWLSAKHMNLIPFREPREQFAHRHRCDVAECTYVTHMPQVLRLHRPLCLLKRITRPSIARYPRLPERGAWEQHHKNDWMVSGQFQNYVGRVIEFLQSPATNLALQVWLHGKLVQPVTGAPPSFWQDDVQPLTREERHRLPKPRRSPPQETEKSLRRKAKRQAENDGNVAAAKRSSPELPHGGIIAMDTAALVSPVPHPTTPVPDQHEKGVQVRVGARIGLPLPTVQKSPAVGDACSHENPDGFTVVTRHRSQSRKRKEARKARKATQKTSTAPPKQQLPPRRLQSIEKKKDETVAKRPDSNAKTPRPKPRLEGERSEQAAELPKRQLVPKRPSRWGRPDERHEQTSRHSEERSTGKERSYGSGQARGSYNEHWRQSGDHRSRYPQSRAESHGDWRRSRDDGSRGPSRPHSGQSNYSREEYHHRRPAVETQRQETTPTPRSGERTLTQRKLQLTSARSDTVREYPVEAPVAPPVTANVPTPLVTATTPAAEMAAEVQHGRAQPVVDSNPEMIYSGTMHNITSGKQRATMTIRGELTPGLSLITMHGKQFMVYYARLNSTYADLAEHLPQATVVIPLFRAVKPFGFAGHLYMGCDTSGIHTTYIAGTGANGVAVMTASDPCNCTTKALLEGPSS